MQKTKLLLQEGCGCQDTAFTMPCCCRCRSESILTTRTQCSCAKGLKNRPTAASLSHSHGLGRGLTSHSYSSSKPRVTTKLQLMMCQAAPPTYLSILGVELDGLDQPERLIHTATNGLDRTGTTTHHKPHSSSNRANSNSSSKRSCSASSPGSNTSAAHCHKALHCSNSCLAAYLHVQWCDLTALRVLPCCKQPAASSVLTEAQHFKAGTRVWCW